MVKDKMKKRVEKKAQVTLFVLVAIVIISAILIFALWVKPTYISDSSGGVNFESCVQDVAIEGIETLASNAGYINPSFSYLHEDIRYAYLCYTNLYYFRCTVQQPLMKQYFEESLKAYTSEKIRECYINSLEDLKSEGYDVVPGEIKLDYSLEPGIARVLIDAPTIVGTNSFKTFNMKINSPIYETIMIAMAIVQSEAYYGDSDITTMMFYYPDYIIDKWKQSDSTTLYTIQNKNFNIKYRFASRSLAWPAGYV